MTCIVQTHSMPTWVGIDQRVVAHVGVSVKVLRIAGVGYQRVRADEAPQHGIVEAGAVIVQPYCTLVSLPGKAEVGGKSTSGVARLTIRVVPLAGRDA